MFENCTLSINENDGTFAIIGKLPPLNALPESKSGKSNLVYSTSGNIPTTVTVNGKPVILSINMYVKK